MRRPAPRPRQRPYLRLAVAGVGLVVLAVGWKLTGAEPAGAAAMIAADAVPADYVPENSDPAPIPASIDPLGALGAPSDPDQASAPLEFLRVTSGFGMRHDPVGGLLEMHEGVDLAAREGAPVLAAADGVVTVAGENGGYGNLIRIRHVDGWATGYAHLSGFAPGVVVGARVMRGQVIGFVGQTGHATGPHLHFEVVHNGVHVNPMTTPFIGAPAPDVDPHAGAYARLRPSLTSDLPPA